MPGRLFEQKIFGEELLRTAEDEIFAKDKAQGSDNPDGYPTPATQYFTNNCVAAAIKSLSERAEGDSRLSCVAVAADLRSVHDLFRRRK